MFRRHLLRGLALTTAAAAALALGACGGEETPSDSASPGTGSYPVTVGDTTVESRPEKIVSMSATGTEMLYAIGAGSQVAAVDATSNYPPEAPVTDLSGLEANVEAIAAYEPDLVILFFDPGTVADGLKALGVPVYFTPAATTLDDTYAQIEGLGKLTGHTDEAAALVERMKGDVDEILAGAPKPTEPVTVYYEADDTYYSVTSATFIGSLLKEAGLDNIADAADPDGESGGYPQLSAEYILDADPDLILLADTKCCGQNLETVSERPGWDALTAVKNGDVVELDDDIASRWGPRVVDLLRAIVEAVPAE